MDEKGQAEIQRQLEMTIRVFFLGEDPVGLFPLTSHVSHELLAHAVARMQLADPAAFIGNILPGDDSAFWDGFVSSRDFTSFVEGVPKNLPEPFDERVNDILLLLACSSYRLGEFSESPIVNMYMCWAFLVNHDLMKEDSPVYAFYDTMRDLIALPDFPNFSRSDQLLVGRKLMEDHMSESVWGGGTG